MDKFVITGGKRLTGEVTVSGAKNAALAIISGALLCDGVCVIENLPAINDVLILQDILTQLGVKVKFADHTMQIDPSGLNSYKAPYEMVRRMRASYYLMGVLLTRFGRFEVAMPGGCQIGSRPVDQHLKGLRALNATIENVGGTYVGYTDKLIGNEVYLDVVSVGATVNIMLAAVKASGTTTIINAAKEPHVVDLANFLNSMGAKIKGAGTDTIKIKGVDFLHGCTYTIIPDQIETGTWMMIAAATRGDIRINNVIPTHMESVSAKLTEMGVTVEEGDDYLRVSAPEGVRLRPVNIKTLPYPGYPTDLQQPITVLLSTAAGTSIITETIFESRFKHIDEIARMGAHIRIDDRTAVVEGVDKLLGAPVRASDLRAGAALIVAALMAEGTSEIYNITHIDRGYENIEKKLLALNADIRRVPAD
ncbi:MAG: UDP-N-acetylglucosamine 1-carboxyvinyltransferase [Eubacteriales bacterium]|nr:UDP-N-acetylglucosamine 1-carboxyvinyltransferase [Eubacteriales bacterium]